MGLEELLTIEMLCGKGDKKYFMPFFSSTDFTQMRLWNHLICFMHDKSLLYFTEQIPLYNQA